MHESRTECKTRMLFFFLLLKIGQAGYGGALDISQACQMLSYCDAKTEREVLVFEVGVVFPGTYDTVHYSTDYVDTVPVRSTAQFGASLDLCKYALYIYYAVYREGRYICMVTYYMKLDNLTNLQCPECGLLLANLPLPSVSLLKYSKCLQLGHSYSTPQT